MTDIKAVISRALSLIFGRWDVVQSGVATASFISQILKKEWEEQVGISIERHSRTGKERAFIHHLDGRKQKTSIDVVRAILPGAKP